MTDIEMFKQVYPWLDEYLGSLMEQSKNRQLPEPARRACNLRADEVSRFCLTFGTSVQPALNEFFLEHHRNRLK